MRTTTKRLYSERTRYDLVGNLTGMADRNGRVRNSSYDGLGHQTAKYWYRSGQLVNSIVYQFDPLDRLTSLSSSDWCITIDTLTIYLKTGHLPPLPQPKTAANG